MSNGNNQVYLNVGDVYFARHVPRDGGPISVRVIRAIGQAGPILRIENLRFDSKSGTVGLDPASPYDLLLMDDWQFNILPEEMLNPLNVGSVDAPLLPVQKSTRRVK